MPVNAVWKLYAIEFGDDASVTGTTNWVIGSMASSSMPTDMDVVREQNAGNIFAEHSHTSFRSANANLTTWNAAGILAKLGTEGFCFDTTDPNIGVSVYVARYDCNAFAAGNVHTRYTFKRGIVYPTSLTVDHQQNVQVGFTIVGIAQPDGSGGLNAPVIKTTNVGLPAITTDFGGTTHNVSARWTMDKTTLRGVAMTGKKSINIDWGAQVQPEGADSEIYDTWVSLNAVLPTIRYNGIDPDWFGTHVTDIGGTKVLHADTQAYFLKRDVAPNVAEHILIGAGGTAMMEDNFSATGNDNARTTVRLDTIQDGANKPLAISVNQIIPP